eukprot:g9869.t1
MLEATWSTLWASDAATQQGKADFGVNGSKTTEFCSRHAREGMVNPGTKRIRVLCFHAREIASNGKKDNRRKSDFCSRHAENGMIHVRGKLCRHPGCTTRANFGVPESRRPEFCSRHAKDGMIDVCNTRCSHTGCTTQTKAELCARHASEGTIGFKRKKPKRFHMSVISSSVKQELRAGAAEHIAGSELSGPSGDGGEGSVKRARGYVRRVPGAEAAAMGLFFGLRKKGT